MAIIKSKPISKLVKTYTNLSMRPGVNKLVHWSWEARRAIILGKRIAAGALIGVKEPNTREHSQIKPAVEDLIDKQENNKELSPNVAEHSKMAHNKDLQTLVDFVAIVDIDKDGLNKGYEYIILPFVPRELNVTPETNYARIKQIGRNSSKYHYTGSEDIIEFEIDWYAHDHERREVIEKCRKIEALSKADGYQGDPHRVMLFWGQNDVLFRDQVFVILSAPYKLSNFNRGYLDKTNQVVSTNMLPIQAYQTVRLGRVSSHNLLKRQIEYVALSKMTSSSLETPSPSQELRF